MLHILTFPCLSDNFGFLIHDDQTLETACIDTPEPAEINAVLDEKGWKLTHILNTHHHFDHVGGNIELKKRWHCSIWGASNEREKIPAIDHNVLNLPAITSIPFGKTKFEIIHTPGHTACHISYYIPEHNALFVGDTLFSLGCGRIFDPKLTLKLWESLQKLQNFPDETRIYCAHEYTLNNAEFSLSILPKDKETQKQYNKIKEIREKGEQTIPTILATEKSYNLFLNTHLSKVKEALQLPQSTSSVDTFIELRKRKDVF